MRPVLGRSRPARGRARGEPVSEAEVLSRTCHPWVTGRPTPIRYRFGGGTENGRQRHAGPGPTRPEFWAAIVSSAALSSPAGQIAAENGRQRHAGPGPTRPEFWAAIVSSAALSSPAGQIAAENGREGRWAQAVAVAPAASSARTVVPVLRRWDAGIDVSPAINRLTTGALSAPSTSTMR